MTVRVIIPPAPFLTPAEIPGAHASNDPAVARAIAAATRTIDGPFGRLRVCLGKQTLELSLGRWGGRNFRIPCPPIIKSVSLKYLDAAGVEQTIDPVNYRVHDGHLWFVLGYSFPNIGCYPDVVRLRYEAGHDGVPPADGGTGDVPPEAIEAVIMITQHMIRSGNTAFGVRSETVEDVGQITYLDADRTSLDVNDAVDRLLSGLKQPLL